MDYSIGVDVGTTSTKGVLYDDHSQVVAAAKYGYPLHRDASGMAEQDPEKIVGAVKKVITKLAKRVDFIVDNLLAVSFSSANQSLVLLDDHLRPLSRMITWADTRAAKVAEDLRTTVAGKQLYGQTGTPIHPMSPVIKLMWLQQQHPEIISRTKYFGGIKSYLFAQLCGEFKVDISVASGSGLCNIHTGHWDADALMMAGITSGQLPEIVDGYQSATVTDQAAKEMGIPTDTPFFYGGYDGALSNIGVGADSQQTVAITIGTSAAVRVATDHPVIDPERRLFCYAIDRHSWVVGGPLNNGGDVFQWAVQQLVDWHDDEHQLIDPYKRANEMIEQTPAGAHGLFFHPYMGGERAPLWNANAKGDFTGMTPMHTRADMMRAVMEGISLNIATVYQILTNLVGQPQSVTATGGFANSKVWRQMLADVLGSQVTVPQSFESGCLGANTMAMVALGKADSLADAKNHRGHQETYLPDPVNASVYRQMMPLFQRIQRALAPSWEAIGHFQKQLGHLD